MMVYANCPSSPAAERRAATVATVVSLAATHNPSEIMTTALARQLRLTQGALFKHVPTKVALFEAVMEWVAETLMARVDKAVHGASLPMASLDASAAALRFSGTIQGLVMPSLQLGDSARITRDAPLVFAIDRRAIGSAA